MGFVLGLLIGGAAGVAAGLFVRSGRADALARTPAVAVVAAAVALVVAAVALARSSPGTRTEVRTVVAAPTSTSAPPASSTTTTTTLGRNATVVVPDVQGLERDTAAAELQQAGLKVSLESISLANVPSGHVISQSPLPDSTVPAGTTVQLVISAAA